MKRLVRIGVMLAIAWLLAVAPAAGESRLAFGVLNQQSLALTAERWNPILDYVTSRTGVPLVLRMGPTVQETDSMMGRGVFDFMFTNHSFQSEYDGVGYRVIARWAGEPIRAVIVTSAAGPIRHLRELDGKAVAFASKDAFVGYAVPLVALRDARVTVREVFAANQEGALAQLKASRVDAAAANSRFLAHYAEREGVRFREIYLSEPYPELAVIVHRRVPAETVETVRRALIGMADDPAAAPILARAKSKGFILASDREYDGVRRIYRLIGQ
jgi:phosphonate transport system substrate-binding protein